MELVASYKFQVNAHLALQELESGGIYAEVREQRSDTMLFTIHVKESDAAEARKIIGGLDLDDSDVDPDSEHYLEGHVEWTNKMYDPGHFSGGRIPHWFTSRLNKKLLGTYYLVILGVGLLTALAEHPLIDPMALLGIVTGLLIISLAIK